MTDAALVDVLLVEDDPGNVRLTLHALKSAKLSDHVHAVQDGAEALEFIFCEGQYASRHIEDVPKVVLLDLNLPRVGGLEVLRQMKADPRTTEIPVVVLTSSREQRDVADSYRLGASSYIVKSLDFNQFVSALQHLNLYWLTPCSRTSPTPLRVLILEAHEADAELMLQALRRGGFEPTWHRVTDEVAYRSRLEASLDVILSDYDIPSFGAVRALQLLRESGLDIPFIVVSGNIGEDLAAETLRRGASDYLLKDRLERLGPAVTQTLQQKLLRVERRQMTRALAEAEEKYRGIFENAVEGIYQAAADGSLLVANPALAHLLGYGSPSELMESTTWQKVYVEAERWAEFMEVIRSHASVSGFEVEVRRRDGTPIWISEHARAIIDDQGQVVTYESLVEEITARKEAELRLKRVIASNPAVIYELGFVAEKLSLSWISENLLALTGFTADQAMAPSWWLDHLHPDDLDRVLAAHETLYASAHNLSEYRFQRRNGSYVWVRDEQRLVRDAQGKPQSVVGSMSDVTERRRTEEALSGSELRFRQIADNIQSVYFLYSADLTEAFYVSPAYERIWGCTCASIYERPQSYQDAIHADDLPGLVAAQQASFSFDHEFRIARPDGTERWIRSRGFPIYDERGDVIRVAGVADDVTEYKEMESRFQQAQKMEAVGQLAGGVAHDFNNVLTTIVGYTDLVLDTLVSGDPRRADLEEVQKAASRAATLTRQLLAFSRKQIMDLRPLDLRQIVLAMEGMLRRLIGEDIDLECFVKPDTGLVKADAGQIEQVLMNLAVNARDAMPFGGKLSIEVLSTTFDEDYARLHPGVNAGVYVMLAVSDTGSGIPDHIQEKIFEPFFTTKEEGKGTGLGLATCFGIVKQSNGHIAVNSEMGHGTTFKIYLPRIDAELEPAMVPLEVTPRRGSELLLLVEDEAPIRQMTARVLRDVGYTVLEAADGEEGWRVAGEHGDGVDLVVTDVIMPNMSGKELADRMRVSHPQTLFLFCSGYTDDAIVHHGVLEPGIAFMHKPYSPNGLAVKVRQLLDARAS